MLNERLVTFLVVTYNQEAYIADSVKGALSQNYSPLEIIISDDCSRDNTFCIAKDIVSNYKGPHNVRVLRNDSNMGIASHLQKLYGLAKGEIIIVSSGDDVSLPKRTKTLMRLFDHETAGVFSNAILIDENGHDNGLYYKNIPEFTSDLEQYKNEPVTLEHCKNPEVWCLGATFCAKKSVFVDFPCINRKVLQEDGVYSFRALLLGKLKYIHTPLIKYRRHSGAISNSNNIRNRIKLLKNEYYYYRNQLTDACFVRSDLKVKVKVITYCIIAFAKKVVFSIPIVNKLILRAAQAIKKR